MEISPETDDATLKTDACRFSNGGPREGNALRGPRLEKCVIMPLIFSCHENKFGDNSQEMHTFI